MLRYLLDDEVFTEHLSVLGPALGPAFHELCDDFLVLNEKWREFVALFGSSPRRIDLLDRAAPRFFGFLELTLFDDAVLHLVRLTSAPKPDGLMFPTIRCLPDLITDAVLR